MGALSQLAVLLFALGTLGCTRCQPLLNTKAWRETSTFFTQPVLPQTVKPTQNLVGGACSLVVFNLTLDYTNENSDTFPSYGAVCTTFAQVGGPTLLLETLMLKEGVKALSGILEYAELLGALVILHEWRYMGWSLPLQFMETGDISGYKMDFILQDAITFVEAVQGDYGFEGSPVLLNSPGVEALLARSMYPDFFIGATLSSEYIYNFPGQFPQVALDATYRIETEVAQRANPECPMNIRNGFRLLEELGNSTEGRAQINKVFNLCEDVQVSDFASVWLAGSLRSYIANMIGGIMVAQEKVVPDEANGYPPFLLTKACEKYLSTPLEGDQLLQAFADFVAYPRQVQLSMLNKTDNCLDMNVYEARPVDYWPSDLLMDSWRLCSGYLYNQLAILQLPNGVTDMYYPASSLGRDLLGRDFCKDNHPTLDADPYWGLRTFGPNMTAFLANLTNVVFIYGEADSSIPFGPATNISDSVVTIIFPGGGFDPNADYVQPYPELKAAKDRVVSILKGWIEEVEIGQKGAVASSSAANGGRKLQQIEVDASVCELGAKSCSDCNLFNNLSPCEDSGFCCLCYVF